MIKSYRERTDPIYLPRKYELEHLVDYSVTLLMILGCLRFLHRNGVFCQPEDD